MPLGKRGSLRKSMLIGRFLLISLFPNPLTDSTSLPSLPYCSLLLSFPSRPLVLFIPTLSSLLSENGIPALCRAAKKFKPRGKGREADDLRQVLNMYQMWAHGMFPKGDFAHTMHRTETVCRSRRMEVGFLHSFSRLSSPSPLR